MECRVESVCSKKPRIHLRVTFAKPEMCEIVQSWPNTLVGYVCILVDSSKHDGCQIRRYCLWIGQNASLHTFLSFETHDNSDPWIKMDAQIEISTKVRKYLGSISSEIRVLQDISVDTVTKLFKI